MSCGSLISSRCVLFDEPLSFLSEQTQLPCKANLSDAIAKISSGIKDLQTVTDVTNYNYGCLGSISNPNIIKISQAQTTKICALEATLTSLQQQFAALNIANTQINIDLGCLSAAAAPCQISNNLYTLISILNLFKNEICAIKNELGI